jgi:proteic killer suppression protein
MQQTNDIYEVTISDAAIKQLRQTPIYIKEKLYKWVAQVKLLGLCEVRKIKSYHDEPLRGNRLGQRSIRLNKAYRAIYVIQEDKTIKFAAIREANKHDY